MLRSARNHQTERNDEMGKRRENKEGRLEEGEKVKKEESMEREIRCDLV